MRGARAARLSWRIGREVPFVIRDGANEVDGQAIKHSTVTCEVVDQHNDNIYFAVQRDQNYSPRSTTAGCVRAARRAGRSVATSVTRTSNPVAIPNSVALVGVTSYRRARRNRVVPNAARRPTTVPIE